ncbi:MAG: hypothetical protein DSY43_00020 [Gammaproteobacteria bacterium]|nr:MAG: hypothetical protein DSY43_00020 [Gammaproteobacteria bacterium]
MHALESRTWTTLVDNPVMNKCLAEFLLQVQSGLPQGSIKTGLQSPVGSLLMSSNSKECVRYVNWIMIELDGNQP